MVEEIQRQKQKPKKQKLKKKLGNPIRNNFSSIFASNALPGFARAFAKLINQGFSASEAVKKIKNKE
tara:strand:+ start:33 stop:233 length:201 start_codon:yes stop_codon:yes gene_type:complete